MCILETGLELISSLYIIQFWVSFFGDFGGHCFAEFQQKVTIVGLCIKVKTCSRLHKSIKNNHFDWNKTYFTKKAHKKECIKCKITEKYSVRWFWNDRYDTSWGPLFFSNLTYVNFWILASKIKNKKHMSPKFCGQYRKTHITCPYHFSLPSVSCLRCQTVFKSSLSDPSACHAYQVIS